MKRYTFEVVIEEGSDEFWESIKGSGCDEVRELLVDALDNIGFVAYRPGHDPVNEEHVAKFGTEPHYDCEITLKKFEDA